MALLRHPWPGNVRELRDVVRRAALAARGPIPVDDLPSYLTGRTTVSARAGEAYGERLVLAEREFLRQVLAQSGNDLRAAAQALGLDPVTLRQRLQKLGLPPGEDDDVVEVG
jgi:two-component system NtrC family response regulator